MYFRINTYEINEPESCGNKNKINSGPTKIVI